MRIAIIAPVEESVPPLKYGGTERVVYEVAKGIGRLGHQVDLYASGDSEKNDAYTLFPTVPHHLRGTPEYKQNEKMRDIRKLMLISEIVEDLQSRKYDLIHNNMDWRYLLFSHFVKTPSVTTHHGPLDNPSHQLIYKAHPDTYHVSISNNQRTALPGIHYVATVYNGTDTEELAFNAKPAKDHMLFLARLSPEKGASTAAKVAIKMKKDILFATKIDIADKNYYENEFKEYMKSPYIQHEGELGDAEKVKTIQNAKLLLVPIQWEEPFGLMFTESMSCGTPVVTFSRGSAPEIIVDGVTGFLVNQSEALKRGNYIIKKTGIDGLIEAIDRIYAMSDVEYGLMRVNARSHVEKHFTIAHMVAGYEKVYRHVIEESKK